MKIAQLCLSPALGGLEIYVARLAEWLAGNGYDCTVIARPGTRLAARVTEKAIHFYPLATKNKYLPLVAARRLARFIDENAIDVLHLHWKYDLPLAVWAKRLARRPVKLVHTRHMTMPHAKHDAYHRFLYRHLDAFIAVTEQVKRQALAQLPMPAERIHRLYPGAPAPTPAIPCEAFYRETNIERRSFMVGLIGRVKHFKGQHVLIGAMENLVAKGLDAGAVIIGHAMEDGYLGDLQTRVAAAGMEAHVRFLGFHENPAALMPCFDVVVLTTYEETFGLVLVEAMRAGTAVIGTNAGGAAEIIEHETSGLLVNPGDADDLAAALERLYNEPELKSRLAEAGRARADALFAEDVHFHELAALFEKIV